MGKYFEYINKQQDKLKQEEKAVVQAQMLERIKRKGAQIFIRNIAKKKLETLRKSRTVAKGAVDNHLNDIGPKSGSYDQSSRSESFSDKNNDEEGVLSPKKKIS